MNDGYELMKSEKQKFLDDCKTAGVEIYNTTAEEDQFYYDIAWQMADELMATTDIGDLGKQLIEAIKAPELAPGA